MALLFLLSFFDFLCILVFVLVQFLTIPIKILYIIGAYLIIKGVLFTVLAKDIASIIDLICGLYALIITLGYSSHIATTLVIIYLLQKILFGFLKF